MNTEARWVQIDTDPRQLNGQLAKRVQIAAPRLVTSNSGRLINLFVEMHRVRELPCAGARGQQRAHSLLNKLAPAFSPSTQTQTNGTRYKAP